MTTCGFKKLIPDATLMLPWSLSRTDLIFTAQPNYVVDCGTHAFLNKKLSSPNKLLQVESQS